ncbi:MAG: anti-sigma factor family protein [Longimicrobiaceae bacterium]
MKEPDHLSEGTLQALAGGELPAGKRSPAQRHLRVCARCRALLAEYRALAIALASLPGFSPAADFAKGVMARVKTRRAEDPVTAWLGRLVPRTTRGWRFLLASLMVPATALVAAAAWIAWTPISAASAWRWATVWLGESVPAFLAGVTDGVAGSEPAIAAQVLLGALPGVALTVLAAALVIFLASTPAALWGLVKLLKTPVEPNVHAHA